MGGASWGTQTLCPLKGKAPTQQWPCGGTDPMLLHFLIFFRENLEINVCVNTSSLEKK